MLETKKIGNPEITDLDLLSITTQLMKFGLHIHRLL